MHTDAIQRRVDGVSGDQDAPSTQLRGRWLLAARTGWVAVTALILGLVTAGFAVGLDRPELIHPQSAQDALAQAGVPGQVTVVAGLIVPMAVFAATGLLIFWRRSDDWAAMLVALTLVTGAGYSMRAISALERSVPQLQLPARFVWLLTTFLYLILLFVFPDGRFVPRWTRLLGAAAAMVAVLLSADLVRIFVELPDVPQGLSEVRRSLAVLVWAGFWGLASGRRRTATGTSPGRCNASKPSGSPSASGWSSASSPLALSCRACSSTRPTHGSAGRCWRRSPWCSPFRYRLPSRSCATVSMTSTGCSAALSPMGCSRSCSESFTPAAWSSSARHSAREVGTRRSPWPPPAAGGRAVPAAAAPHPRRGRPAFQPAPLRRRQHHRCLQQPAT